MTTQLPSGTVTFLFTDIERSTENVSALGDERYAELQAIHRKLLREAMAAHSGVEVGTEGDAFFVAFARAGDAVGAALEGQRALEAHAWPDEGRLRVRIGLHTGEALVRDDDYVGHDVHKAKRISDAGHGGQVLLSESTAALVRSHPPAGTTFTDLGPHRLKDLEEPQRLFQVTCEGLETTFPPLRTLDAIPHNLPVQLSSFVGRDADVDEVAGLVRAHRLVTLTGAAGCGKTRLALHVASELLTDFRDGAWVVELAPIAGGELALSTTAAALGIRDQTTSALDPAFQAAPPRPLDERLIEHLRTKTLLLVLDNCEHVIESCADLVGLVLRSCPRVRIIATSREPLGISGEATWRVPSLAVPDPEASADQIGTAAAVRLFCDRAPELVFAPENASAIAHICARLEGIPLAIELAAARVPMLSPAQIADRLDDRFRLLTGGARTALERQQTLRAAVDWSYALLTEPERVLLRRVTVFTGGFDLEAAEAVCSGDPIDERDVLELLTQLYRKSLVLAEDRDGAPRYRLLETIRQYAREKLVDTDEGPGLRDRHLTYFKDLADATWQYGRRAGRGPLDARFETEIDNIRAALEWGMGREEAVALASGLDSFWIMRLRRAEGLKWIETALEAAGDVSPLIRARGLTTLGRLVALAGDWERAQAAIDEGLRLYGEAGDRAGEVYALARDAFLAYQKGDHERASAVADHLLDLARAIDDQSAQVVALMLLGRYEAIGGDLNKGRELIDEALRVARAVGDDWGIALMHYDLGMQVQLLGDIEEARLLYERSLSLALTGDHPMIAQIARGALARADIAAGINVEQADRELRDALEMEVRSGEEVRGGRYNLLGLAQAAYLLGDAQRAATLIGAAASLSERYGLVTPGRLTLIYDADVDAVRAALSDDDFSRAFERGRAMTLTEALAFALDRSDA